MSRFPVARKLSPLFALVAVLLLPVAARAAEPVPSTESFLQSLQLSDCAQPASEAAAIPGMVPDGQLKGFDSCSPLCGYAGCRGAAVGSFCTKANGTAGTCYGPSLGKKCADGLPMCLCV